MVERLAEVCSFDFNTIPVVNMAGRIIGLIPRNFVIVLLENHAWYDEDDKRGKSEHGAKLSMNYRTAVTRQMSMASMSQKDEDEAGEFSPRGSVDENGGHGGNKVGQEIEFADGSKETDRSI